MIEDLIRQLILRVRIEERDNGPVYEGGHRERRIIEDYSNKFATLNSCPCNGGCHNGHTRMCSEKCRDKKIAHIAG